MRGGRGTAVDSCAAISFFSTATSSRNWLAARWAQCATIGAKDMVVAALPYERPVCRDGNPTTMVRGPGVVNWRRGHTNSLDAGPADGRRRHAGLRAADHCHSGVTSVVDPGSGFLSTTLDMEGAHELDTIDKMGMVSNRRGFPQREVASPQVSAGRRMTGDCRSPTRQEHRRDAITEAAAISIDRLRHRGAIATTTARRAPMTSAHRRGRRQPDGAVDRGHARLCHRG